MPPALIAGAVTIGGSVLSANAAKSAANTAANAQAQANAQALALQQQQYEQARGDLTQWVDSGRSASQAQGNLLGLNGPDQQAATIAALKASPLYQSLFNNGQETLLANAAATGGLRGGNTQAALANFGRDTLAGVIDNQLTRLGAVSEQGQNAAAQTGQFGANMANQGAALLNNTGAAQGNAALVAGKAQAGMINSVTGALTGLAGNTNVQQWAGRLF